MLNKPQIICRVDVLIGSATKVTVILTGRLGKGTGKVRNRRTSRDHPNYSIVKIDQNTEMSPGYMKKLMVTQTTGKNHQLTLVWKIRKDHYHFFFLYSFKSFSHRLWLMVFHWSLSDSKSPQVSRTLLSILADLKKAVVWMVSTPPLISKSSSPCIYPLVSVPNAPITIGITVTFMFHSFLGFFFFFCYLAKCRYLSLFSLYFSFTLWSAWIAKYYYY